MKEYILLCFVCCTYCFAVNAQDNKIFSEGGKQKTSAFSITPSGLEYKIIKDSVGGISPEAGGFITFWFEMRTPADSIFDSQFADPNPAGIPTPTVKHKQSIEEGLLLLTEGDSAIFLLNADSLYLHTFGREAPTHISEERAIQMIVKMSRVYSKHFVDSAITAQRIEEAQIAAAEQKIYIKDSILIHKYLTEHKLKGEVINGGIYIVKLKSEKKKNPYIVRGEIVETTYIGKLLIEGTEFDRSSPGVYFEFMVGVGEVIKGWDNAFQRLKPGEKALILIPSGMAYGEAGVAGLIPPNAPLLFEVEIKK